VNHPTLDPKANHLLASLPPDDWSRWLAQLARVEMALGEVMYESGSTLSQVYFPNAVVQSAGEGYRLKWQSCRWLLPSLDRLSSNELVMTQELIADMLGVRREGVTEGALKLQKAGLITYTRGRIEVLDRAGLEAQSRECYAVVKKECDRLLPPIPAK